LKNEDKSKIIQNESIKQI